jgi:hypothetical protein
MFLFTISTLVSFFLTVFLCGKLSKNNNDDSWFILLFVWFGCWISIFTSIDTHAYKNGQIDAMNNKWRYERQILKTEKTKKISTNYIKIPELLEGGK